MKATMTAVFLPGDSTVEMRTVPVPEPGHGEVLLRVKASTICGSDIRCIYHEPVSYTHLDVYKRQSTSMFSWDVSLRDCFSTFR